MLISSISSSDVNKNKGVAETAPSYKCALSTTLLGTSWLLTLMNVNAAYCCVEQPFFGGGGEGEKNCDFFSGKGQDLG